MACPADPKPSRRQPQADMAPNPSRRRQARPSKSKPRQANPNKIAWICLVLFVRIGTYQWVTAIPNKNFSPLALRLIAKRASPGAPSFSDYCNDVGRLPIFARGESKDCGVLSLIRLGPPAAASAEPVRGVKSRVGISPANAGALRALTGREWLHQALLETEPTANAIRARFLALMALADPRLGNMGERLAAGL